MLIAGIAGSGHKTLNRGDAIPMDPKQKAGYAAIRGWSDKAPEGAQYVCHSADVLSCDKITGSPGQYEAVATVSYRTLRHRDERVFSLKTVKLSLQFKEVKDSLGLDDLEIITITEKELQ